MINNYGISLIVRMTKKIARMHIMEKININLMERYLLLLDRFVDKLAESGFSEQRIIEQSYLFCAGFYIKYQSGIEKMTFSNREVVLTFLLLSYYSHINKLDDDLINKERMKHVCSSLINFIVSNGSRTEKVYANEKRKYEASTLKRSLSIKEKKRKENMDCDYFKSP